MCGPIVGAIPLVEWSGGSRLKAIFFYQLGRALPYGGAGAIAGYFGSSDWLENYHLGWVIVFILSCMAFLKFLPISLPVKFFNLPIRYMTKTVQFFPAHSRSFVFGGLLAFLPCMLSFWALHLAATTKSPFKGAICMLLLIILTSLPIALSISFGGWLRSMKARYLEGGLLLVSAIWCFLMTAANQGWIEHSYLHLKIFETNLMLMFW